MATSIREALDQDISFDQALVLENVAIDVALMLTGETRENFITATIGQHPPCSSRWVELHNE